MNLAQTLHDAGRTYPSRPALGFGDSLLYDYATLAQRVAQIASALQNEFRLQPGDRVAIVASNVPEYVEALYAIWHAGGIAVPTNAKLHGTELAAILEHSGARICFASSDLASVIDTHAPRNIERIVVFNARSYDAMLAADAAPIVPRDGDDVAWLFYTTAHGQPKGAMLTHRNLRAMSRATMSEVDRIGYGDPFLHVAPMGLGSGFYIVPYVEHFGVNVVPESGGFYPDELFRLLETWPRSSMLTTPTMVNRMVAHPAPCNVENIRTIICAGPPLSADDTTRAMERFGPRFAYVYGPGETALTMTLLSRNDVAYTRDRRWRERIGSLGKPFKGMEIVAVDADGTILAPGETGDILCRGETVMAGYWQDPTATAVALAGGYLQTGDIGSFDEQGYLHLTGRSNGMILSGGASIHPREVEEALLRHPGVREAAVIGRPDREWGEIVVAYVVGDANAGDLDLLCLNWIARYKRPRDYVFIPALPKSEHGQVLDAELRRLDAERAPAMAAVTS